MKSTVLLNGVKMPCLGLGVYKMRDSEQAIEAIVTALQAGYRSIDTASYYQNEQEVGEAVRLSEIPRSEIFITTKVWNKDQGYDKTLFAFEESLRLLGLDYLDLYLTHWPVPDKFVDTYRAIERLYEEKLIRVPGVSNHHQEHLMTLEQTVHTMPMVNQIECHPYLQQTKLISFCQEKDIAVTSWSPLGRGSILKDEVINQIATNHNKTAAQIIIKWHLQRHLIVIPKSVTPSRIMENKDVFDFTLTEEDMNKIACLERGGRTGANPSEPDFLNHFNS